MFFRKNILVKTFTKQRNLFNLFLIIFIFLYTLAAVLVSLHRFWQYESFFYDLGIFEQALWRVSKFQAPIIDNLAVGGKIVFADHFYPSLFILSPLYWFTNKTEIILVAQAVAVGLSLLIAFLIAKKAIKSKLVVLALITAYAGYIGLQNAIITDFHSLTVSVLPLMIVFWTIFKKKWKFYWLALIFLLGFKESMVGLGIAIGIYLLFKEKKRKDIGIRTIIVSLTYFLLVAKIFIPLFNDGTYNYKPYIHESIFHFFQSFFWPQIKLKTLLVSFSTFGFLPLFYPPLLPAFIEHFLERFVFNVAGTRWQLGFHYNAVLSPLMFISSLEVFKMMEQKKKYKKAVIFIATSIILIVVFYHRFFLHGPLGLAYHPVFYAHTKRQGFMDDFIKQIPRKGLLMTQNNIAPRFTHQKVILLKDKKNYKKFSPDYVAIDLRGGQNGNNFFSLTEEKTWQLVEALQKDKDYGLIVEYSNYFIFEKKQ